MKEVDLIYKDLSYRFVGCCFNVRNKYGRHLSEKAYHQFLPEELNLVKIGYVYKPRIKIYSLTTGKAVTYFEPDLLVEDKIIIELKALPFAKPDHRQQLLNYLATSKYELGYLVNFGEKDFKPQRIIHTLDQKNFLNKNIKQQD